MSAIDSSLNRRKNSLFHLTASYFLPILPSAFLITVQHAHHCCPSSCLAIRALWVPTVTSRCPRGLRVWVGTAEELLIHALSMHQFFPPGVASKRQSQKPAAERLWQGCRRGALGPHVRHQCDRDRVRRQKRVGNIWRCHRPRYMYIYVYVHGLCFQYTFQPKQIRSQFKYITSKCLVQLLYMCVGCFFPLRLLCFVLLRWKLQVKWEVHNSLTLFLFLEITPFREQVWMTPYPGNSCLSVRQVKVCFCELSLWGTQLLCHITGYELVTCWEVLLMFLTGRKVLLDLTTVLLLCMVSK